MTRVAMVIDKSGSMQSIRHSAMQGFNDFLREQQKIGSDARVTLRVFNDCTDDLYSGNIMECPELSDRNYGPSGGTALLDALGDTLERMLRGYEKSDPKPQVVIVLLTDGEEADSQRWSWAQAKSMVKKCRDLGWEFIFLGADDQFDAQAELGIDPKRQINFTTDKAGVKSAFAQISQNVSRLRLGA